MALNHSPSIVTNGLVFAYDMGNPQKSWKGAPTTNLATTQTLVNHSLVTLPTFSDAPEKGVGWKKAIVTATSSNFRMLRMDAFNVLANSTTTYSIEFECNSPEVYLNIDGTGFGGGAWTKIGQTRYSRTVTTATAGQAYLFVCSNNLSANVNYIIYYKEHQIENNSFATPFVAGTRSNTQAIVDLTNTNTVTANSSISYLSNNTFEFSPNNNNSTLTVPLSTSLNKLTGTISAWVYPKGYSGSNGIFVNRDDSTSNALDWLWIGSWSTGGTFYFRLGNGADCCSQDLTVSSWSSVCPVNTWSNVCVTWQSGSFSRIYMNGKLIASRTITSIPNTNPSVTGRIGLGHVDGSSGSWNGAISNFSIFNRALSDTEVSQNFNALRGRFGL